MSEAFLQLSAEEQADILQTYASKLGRRVEQLEKDVWICWCSKVCLACPTVFRWLSKVYGAIRRFSEDVDVTVEYKSLGPRPARTGSAHWD